MLERVYELPLARDYVQHWGVTEAVRELFQNALDSDSPFEWSVDGDSLSITSRHASLEPRTLLLGATSKNGAVDKIGKFGEGYKIALLVLTREQKTVCVHNGSVDWTPEFRFNRRYDSEILCIREKTPLQRQEGLTFSIQGLDQQEMDAIISSNLHMWPTVGQTIETSKGRILLDHPGKLFINGLFVCQTQMKYGYDMKPRYLPLERDRQTVSNFDLALRAKEMWFETDRTEHIAKMIEDHYPDMEYADWNTPEVVKEACYELFKKTHPGAIAASSQSELKQMVADGMTNVVYIGDTYANILNSHEPYKTEVVPKARVPVQVLEDWFKENRGNMHRLAIVAFKKLLVEAKTWKL